MLSAHLRHGLRLDRTDLDAYLKQIEGGGAARPSASRRARWTSFTSRRRGRAPSSGTRRAGRLFQTLIGYMRRRQQERGLRRGQHAADPRPRAVGNLRPLADLSRAHVRHDDGGRSRLRAEADELPGPRADLQERAEVLSRSARKNRRVRHRPSLRAVRRAARRDARARLHAGRRAHLLHRRPDPWTESNGDQRHDPKDLQGFRLR